MKILVTAGPTREALDPVRFLSNRSSGRMGYAVARAAAARGHGVCLVSGPVALAAPAGVELERVVSAQDMCDAVAARHPACDALIMTAAVADWRPRAVAAAKLKKAAGPPRIELERTPDILAAVAGGKGDRVHVGFAAETGGDLVAEARRKCMTKNLDLVVANDVSEADAGFEVATNRVVFVTPDGEEALPLLPKSAVARHIVAWVERRAGVAAGDVPENAPDARLQAQVTFLLEIDALKRILRRSYHLAGGRQENDAEHSWHLAVMALVLAEHADDPAVDIARAVRMVLVHDIVEIDAGDTYCYDTAANRGRVEREALAAERLFGLLPPDQARELHALWREFEARATPEARFAAALDRLQPMLLNANTEGRSWREHGITSEQVLARNGTIADGAPALWAFARALVRDAVARGHLAP